MNKIITLISCAAVCIIAAGCANDKKNESEIENPVIENIMARRSVRQYTDQLVPREVLQKLAECGVNAPNAMNKCLNSQRMTQNPAMHSATPPLP